MQQCIGSRRPLQCSSRSACTSATAQRSAARSLMCSSRLHLTSWDSSNQSSIALQQAVPGVQCTGVYACCSSVLRGVQRNAGKPDEIRLSKAKYSSSWTRSAPNLQLA